MLKFQTTLCSFVSVMHYKALADNSSVVSNVHAAERTQGR